MSFRHWLSIITLAVLVLVVVIAWPEILRALGYLSQVNPWILALLVPVQLVSYWATGQVLFSYLRDRGSLAGLHPLAAARMSLEFNFVNHVLPSGGAAGISYIGWKLSQYGVSPGRSTMAQLVRFALLFISTSLLLVVAVIVLLATGSVSALAIWLSVGVTVVSVGAVALAIFVVSSPRRLDLGTTLLTRIANGAVRIVTFGRKRDVVKREVFEHFFGDLHADYLLLREAPHALIKPFIWSVVGNLADVGLFYVAFLALGVAVNPASLFIAYALSALASVVVVTPNGAGAYEAIMIGFLSSAGVPAGIAIAGTLLARVILMVGTILFGYVFYQLTLLRFGKGSFDLKAARAGKLPAPPAEDDNNS